MHLKHLIMGLMICVNTVYGSDVLKDQEPFTVQVYENTNIPDPHDLNALKAVITNFHVSVHPNGVGDMDRDAYIEFSNKKFDRHGEDLVKGLCKLLIVRKGPEIKGGWFYLFRTRIIPSFKVWGDSQRWGSAVEL